MKVKWDNKLQHVTDLKSNPVSVPQKTRSWLIHNPDKKGFIKKGLVYYGSEIPTGCSYTNTGTRTIVLGKKTLEPTKIVRSNSSGYASECCDYQIYNQQTDIILSADYGRHYHNQPTIYELKGGVLQNTKRVPLFEIPEKWLNWLMSESGRGVTYLGWYIENIADEEADKKSIKTFKHAVDRYVENYKDLIILIKKKRDMRKEDIISFLEKEIGFEKDNEKPENFWHRKIYQKLKSISDNENIGFVEFLNKVKGASFVPGNYNVDELYGVMFTSSEHHTIKVLIRDHKYKHNITFSKNYIIEHRGNEYFLSSIADHSNVTMNILLNTIHVK
jgi:hypothetical protein